MCLFKGCNDQMYLLFDVDDMPIANKTLHVIEKVKADLATEFEMQNLGEGDACYEHYEKKTTEDGWFIYH